MTYSWYVWLVPIIIMAIIAVALFAHASKRKSKTTLQEPEKTEAEKRGKYINR